MRSRRSEVGRGLHKWLDGLHCAVAGVDVLLLLVLLLLLLLLRLLLLVCTVARGWLCIRLHASREVWRCKSENPNNSSTKAQIIPSDYR